MALRSTLTLANCAPLVDRSVRDAALGKTLVLVALVLSFATLGALILEGVAHADMGVVLATTLVIPFNLVLMVFGQTLRTARKA